MSQYFGFIEMFRNAIIEYQGTIYLQNVWKQRLNMEIEV